MADRALDGTPVGTQDDTLWGHRWGFRDTCFRMGSDGCVEVTGGRYGISGTRMPRFHPFAKEIFKMPNILAQSITETVDYQGIPEPRLSESQRNRLQARFPSSKLSLEARDRVLHSHGQTTADEVLRVLYGHLERVVDAVFYGESDQDIADMVEMAGQLDLCLVPYGGGTSVSCALQIPAKESRPVISMDMRRLDKIEWVDRDNMRASVQAGITGRALEEQLNRQGLTCGHEPDSSELSTLGGWIATNASGMKKNRYGNIEDLVEHVTLVTPSGLLANRQVHPRVATGIQPEKLVFGSEGNLGVITRAVMRVFPMPEARQFGSIVFPDFESGAAFLREVARTGPVPASLRLVDNVQFRFSQALKPAAGWAKSLQRWLEVRILKALGYDPLRLCAATIVIEGTAAEVKRECKDVMRIAKRYRGFWGGEANGQRGYALTYAIAYIRDFLAQYSVIGETLETTVPWNAIPKVIAALEQCALDEHALHRLPGVPYISSRITQVYHSGVCIYFTHGYSVQGVECPLEVSIAMEKSMRKAILNAGGSLSHHHGVGKIRSEFLDQVASPAGFEVVRALKTTLDRQNTFGIRNNYLAD